MNDLEAASLKEKSVAVLSKVRFSPWLIWGLGATFFFAEYFARVAPSVIATNLMRDFQVSAAALGSLSACFYYAYVGMQVPVGMLVDRFGAHRLLTIMAMLSALSCGLFASAQSLAIADASRFLFGFAASFAFVGSLKLATVWFPPERFGLLAGLTQAIGMLGASVGGPVSYLVAAVGWRETLWIMSSVFMVLALLIGVLVKDKPEEAIRPATDHLYPESGLLAGLKLVLSNPQSWWNALYVGMVYAPTAAFGELWGPTFLQRAYNLDIHMATYAIGMIFIGWGVGGPIMGWLSDRIRRRRPIMLGSAFFGAIFMGIVIYIPNLPIPVLFLTLFLYGVSNTGVATSYAVASEINPHRVAGTSMAFANMASVIVGASFQPLIGWLLDLQWNGQMLDGVRYYSPIDFRWALVQLPICLILGFFFAFLVRETHCHPKD